MKFAIEIGTRKIGMSVPLTTHTVSTGENTSAKTKACIEFTQRHFPAAYVATLPFRHNTALPPISGENPEYNPNVLHNLYIFSAVLEELCNDLKSKFPTGMGDLAYDRAALELAIKVSTINLRRLAYGDRAAQSVKVDITFPADELQNAVISRDTTTKSFLKTTNKIAKELAIAFLPVPNVPLYRPSGNFHGHHSVEFLQEKLLQLQKTEASLAISHLVMADKNLAAKVRNSPSLLRLLSAHILEVPKEPHPLQFLDHYTAFSPAFRTKDLLRDRFVWMANLQLARLAYGDNADRPISGAESDEPRQNINISSRINRFLKDCRVHTRFQYLRKMHSMLKIIAKAYELQAPQLAYENTRNSAPQMALATNRKEVISFITYCQLQTSRLQHNLAGFSTDTQ
jgi:hypothetical protein